MGGDRRKGGLSSRLPEYSGGRDMKDQVFLAALGSSVYGRKTMETRARQYDQFPVRIIITVATEGFWKELPFCRGLLLLFPYVEQKRQREAEARIALFQAGIW